MNPVPTDNTTQPANGPAAYPKRPAFFALHFIRRMTREGVAMDLGPGVFTLLAVIATEEDANRYRGPVKLFNPDLAEMAGLSVAGMKLARDRAVEAGWLNHVNGAKGRAAMYFVTDPTTEGGSDIVATAKPESEMDTGYMLVTAEPVSMNAAQIVATTWPACEPPNTPNTLLPKYTPTPASDCASATDGKADRKPAPRIKPKADSRFPEFWARYPRKDNKAGAEKAWNKIKHTPELTGAILKAVDAQRCRGCLEPKTATDGRDVRPHAATWLNNRRWEDESPGAVTTPAAYDDEERKRLHAEEYRKRQEFARQWGNG